MRRLNCELAPGGGGGGGGSGGANRFGGVGSALLRLTSLWEKSLAVEKKNMQSARSI